MGAEGRAEGRAEGGADELQAGEEEALQAESRRLEGGGYRPERRPYGEG